MLPALIIGHAAAYPAPTPPACPCCAKLTARLAQLETELSDARQTIEDVACGTRLECPTCGKLQPCLCQNTP